MRYNWLLSASFFWIAVSICHAESEAGAIKDAEFVIEKQKKNKVNQEERLFFNAPTRTTKGLNKPLATVQALTLEDIAFDPAPVIYLPFSLEKKGAGLSFDHYCRLGIGSLALPYLEVALDNCSFAQAIWSTHLAFVPELWNKKSRETSLSLQGKYGIGTWLLQPNLHYQHDWYKYSDSHTTFRRLHQGKLDLVVKQANESSTQDGQVGLSLLKYHHEYINEQLLTLKYKWVKQLDKWSLKVASYNDIAGYKNDTNQPTRFIFSIAPSLYLTLPKAIQLKVGLGMAYHNDPIPDKIPNFDLYPIVKIGCIVTTWLTPYMGIKGIGVGGSVIPLHLHNLVAKNPFIASNSKLLHPHQYFKLYGGTRGILSPHLSYHLHMVYRKLKNQSRIVAVAEDQIRLEYNPQNCNVLKATGLVNYSMPHTKFHTTIKGTYYRYSGNTSNLIWWYHKPLYKLKQMLTYRPHLKVLLKSNLHLHSPTIVKNIDGTPRQLGSIINLSLGMDYFITEKFAAFLMVSNLLNRKHITYTGYPDKKINITGGLQYRW
ncbi:hypothetical protein [Cardinium endosymbiont of Oedothorax gibbosus]|uniref:hypothetical protein n=1 Tax=Cardinium endosymbiont of Oedothorax gibbosus TaxID=931101 RepID=UPI0020259FEE|nr:hypothetical protein [Cardinium endosymbiont of Oedothorax gibbosus]CAH2559743.1 TonB-dependent receptor-like, beta-barrel domainsuperfamily protein [Cardinium endosymbiont of Oedothorax gibbosus]